MLHHHHGARCLLVHQSFPIPRQCAHERQAASATWSDVMPAPRAFRFRPLRYMIHDTDHDIRTHCQLPTINPQLQGGCIHWDPLKRPPASRGLAWRRPTARPRRGSTQWHCSASERICSPPRGWLWRSARRGLGVSRAMYMLTEFSPQRKQCELNMAAFVRVHVADVSADTGGHNP